MPYYELELGRRIHMAGITLPTYGYALAYLENCRRHKTQPNPDHLINNLLPWTTHL